MLLFNRYEYNPKTDLIGKGGFSKVYKAHDIKFNRHVALKVYKVTQLSDRYTPIAEIQRVIDLDHPNLSRYIDIEEIEKEDAFGQNEKIQVCIMELIEGGNFSSFYKLNNNIDIFKKLLADVLHGLSYLHKKGIIHRDIKPANILIQQTPGGPVAKISDFGISKNSDSLDNSSSSGLLVSIPYLAPEQLNAQKYGISEKVHFNIDLWSLGVTVYETITGDVLFKNNSSDSSEQVMLNIVNQELPEKIKLLPPPLNAFVAKCLVKDAKQRVQSADELLQMLEPVVKESAKTSLPAKQLPSEEDKAPSTPSSSKTQKTKQKNTTKQKADQPVNSAPVQNENTGDDYTKEIPKSILKKLVKDNDAGTEEDKTVDETRLIEKPLLDIDATTPLQTNSNDNNKTTPPGDETQLLKLPGAEEIRKPKIDKKNEPVQTHEPEKDLDETKIIIEKNIEKDPAKITLFNRYVYYPLTDLIGKGGFSRVYKAMDQKLGRWVALKIYKTSEFSDRYSPIAEIKRVVNLDHPNICRYLDIEEIEKTNPFGEVEKIQVCVMELMDSGNFSEYFIKNGRDLDVLKKLLQDVLNGISYLHKNGITHRDLKPANILIKQTIDGPVAKITDFGISKESDSVSNNSSSALIVSIPYMAPEQLNIKKYGVNEKISYNLDLWSLGVTIYEIITGQVLFKNNESDSSEQIMANIMAPELPDKIKDLPQPFRSVVSHCIIKNANERAQSADELLVLLKSSKPKSAVNTNDPITVVTPPPEVKKPVQPEVKKTELPKPVADPAEPVVIKSKFSVIEEAPVKEAKAKKQIGFLKTSIVVAAISLTLIAIFYFTRTTKDPNTQAATQATVAKPDTSHVATIPPAKKDSTVKIIVPKDTIPVTKIAAVKENPHPPVDIKEIKKQPEKKTTTAIIEKEPERTEATIVHSTEKFAVNFISSGPCTIFKNDVYYFELNGTEQRYLNTGKYNFTATYKSGLKTSRSLIVSAGRSGHSSIYTVKF